MRRNMTITLAVLLILTAGIGCQEKAPESEQKLRVWQPGQGANLPSEGKAPQNMGMPPHSQQPQPSQEVDKHELPLKLKGVSSLAELQRGLDRLKSEDARQQLETAFRFCFTQNRPKRNYAKAQKGFEAVLAAEPSSPEAYRGLGAIAIHQSFNTQQAIAHYKKAIQLDPAYGAAHYALGLIMSMTDKAASEAHFKRASELGITDTHGMQQMMRQP